MPSFEYQITVHPAESFLQLVYFCSEQGECNWDQVPQNQIGLLTDLLNRKGREGWELVQISFGRDGLMAFWKKPV